MLRVLANGSNRILKQSIVSYCCSMVSVDAFHLEDVWEVVHNNVVESVDRD